MGSVSLCVSAPLSRDLVPESPAAPPGDSKMDARKLGHYTVMRVLDLVNDFPYHRAGNFTRQPVTE
jgi:hypothetical protein